MNRAKVLYMGELQAFTRSYQRFRAIYDLSEEMEYEIMSMSDLAEKKSITLLDRLLNKLGYTAYFFELDKINQKLTDLVFQEKPNLLWIDKGTMVKSQTLIHIKQNFPGIILVLYSPEYIKPKHNHSKYLIQSLPLYDYWLTPMSQNCSCSWVEARKPKNTICVNQGYDKYLHRPLELTDEEKEQLTSDVSFIGTFEKSRANIMLNIAKAGIKVRIWGNLWQKWANSHPNLIIENKPLYGENYIKALCGSKVNLAFLRKANQDQQTSRTIEIPACGAFMLAERTRELQQLFEEGKEVEFFDINNIPEMIEKIKYYLNHEEERKAIAQAARNRCSSSKYSYKEILRPLLKKIIRL
jgi:spore maturation protein CgeB